MEILATIFSVSRVKLTVACLDFAIEKAFLLFLRSLADDGAGSTAIEQSDRTATMEVGRWPIGILRESGLY